MQHPLVAIAAQGAAGVITAFINNLLGPYNKKGRASQDVLPFLCYSCDRLYIFHLFNQICQGFSLQSHIRNSFCSFIHSCCCLPRHGIHGGN